MFALRNPSDADVRDRLAGLTETPFSYPGPGLTRPVVNDPAADVPVALPAGFRADHYRQRLSTGGDDEAWWRAKNAVERWAMFSRFAWLRLVRLHPDTPPAVGDLTAVVVRHFGFWSVNVCRVVYTVDEPDRFGFAYGTLTGQHAELGEERFLVERSAGAVGFDLFAVSRPGPLASLAVPVVRRMQKRFARDAQTAMLWASR